MPYLGTMLTVVPYTVEIFTNGRVSMFITYLSRRDELAVDRSTLFEPSTPASELNAPKGAKRLFLDFSETSNAVSTVRVTQGANMWESPCDSDLAFVFDVADA